MKPLKPTVSLDEFLAYDHNQPETYTSSPVVNAVAHAMAVVRPLTERQIAANLRVDGKKLSYALEIITGYSFSQLRYYWIERQLETITNQNPDISRTELAHRIGLADAASLWHMLRSVGFKNKRRVNVRKDAYTEEAIRERQEELLHLRIKRMQVNDRARAAKAKAELEARNNAELAAKAKADREAKVKAELEAIIDSNPDFDDSQKAKLKSELFPTILPSNN